MKALILVAAVAALLGCTKPTEPVSVTGTNNKQVQVDELFTHDGVTVYRFEDRGRPVYFTSPPTSVRSSFSEACGKGCIRSVDRQTLAAR